MIPSRTAVQKRNDTVPLIYGMTTFLTEFLTRASLITLFFFFGDMNSRLKQRPTFVARMSEESLESKLLAEPDAKARAPAAPPPAPTSSKAVVEAPKDGLDIPVLPVVGVVAAAFAAATFSMKKGKDKREVEQSSSPAPAPVAKAAPAPVAKADDTDISIPYDAAARLAYDHSDKSMEYSKFKDKYEAETVEFIKAKQKK